MHHERINEEGAILIKIFVAADKLNTFKLLNKNTMATKQIMILYCAVHFEQFWHTDIMSSNIDEVIRSVYFFFTIRFHKHKKA